MTEEKAQSKKSAWVRLLLTALLIAGLVTGAYLIGRKQRLRTERVKIVCDMEEVEIVEIDTFFVADGLRLRNGQTRVEGVARSGKFSCLLFQEKEFGVTWESEVLPGEVVEASIWRKSRDQTGFFIGDGNWGFYQEAAATGKQDGEWEELALRIRVPIYARDAKLKLYAWNPNPDPVYYDDLTIRHYKADRTYDAHALSPEDSIPILDLIIGENGMDSLQRIRDAAMAKGLLTGKDDKWVKMDMREEGGKVYPGRLRLKGDWTDHLLGNKWSFRIELADDHAWRQMTTFSVQSPRTRYFLSEWIFHQWLTKENVLTPRYGFIELKVNGKSRGVYAYEEHFEKQLIAANHRPSGPVMKYDEEGLWEAMGIDISEGLEKFETHVPAYKSSNIVPFGSKSAQKDSTLRRQVEMAQQLILQYKTGQKTIWDIFDAPKMASYYAIIDILAAQHGMIWHNQRWYYNPVISRLEPIGYDGYTESGPLMWIDKPFIGFSRNIRYMAAGYRELMFERFFLDRKFLDLYVGALFRYSDPSYLDAFYKEIEPEVLHIERVLQKEWPKYSFDRKGFFERAKTIRMLLLPMRHSSVKVHAQGSTAKGFHYRVYNYHCLPVVLKGVGKKEDKMDAPFAEELLIDAYNQAFPAEYMDAYSSANGKWVFFEVPGIDSTFAVEILPWQEPRGLTPEQALFRDLKITSNPFYQVDEQAKRVTFKTGKYTCAQDLLFPAGYQIWFEKGVELDLINGAKFISKSQVLMFGREDAPILIQSSDRSAQGFTILQAPGKSEFNYVAFDGLNSLHHQGWNLSGGITLYETECLFNHARSVNSQAEDAIHIIRAVFTFIDSYIGTTRGDGLDADYATGTLNNAYFASIDGNAMDFSGGNLTISNAIVETALKNGIRLGEESKAAIALLTLSKCKVGIAVSDLAQVTVQEVMLTDCDQGFSVRQEKPEYGPATLVVEQYKATDVGQLYELKEGSSLSLEGKPVHGNGA